MSPPSQIPAKVKSGTNSTSMIGQHTEPKLQLQKPPEFPRTAEKNITFVSKNADKSNSTNHMPHADDQSVIIDRNKATNIVLKGIDQDNDKIKFDIVSEPLMGVLAGFDKNSGTVMYVPNPGSDGTDRFTFRAVDIHNLQSNVAEVLVIVNTIQDTGHKLADVNAVTTSKLISNEPEQAKSQSSTLSTNPIIINNNPSVNAGLDRSVYEGNKRRYIEGYWQRSRS